MGKVGDGASEGRKRRPAASLAKKGRDGRRAPIPTWVRQSKAAAYLAAGLSPAEVAELVGVAERTVSKWYQDPRFLELLERERDAFLEDAREVLARGAMSVAAALVEKGASGDVAAAAQVLDRVGIIRVEGQQIQQAVYEVPITEAEAIERRRRLLGGKDEDSKRQLGEGGTDADSGAGDGVSGET